MVAVQLPKLNVNDIEILITEKVWIFVNVGFVLNIEQTNEDSRLFELSVSHFVVALPIGHIEHAMNDTKRIPFLEVRAVLQKL